MASQVNFTKNSKKIMTLKKKVQEGTSKWKYILGSWIGRINILKMFIFHKVIFRFNTSPIKITMTFFMELEQIILSLYGTTKGPEYPQQS